MGHHVRAKFRCLEIRTKYDGLIIAELKPVQQKGVNPKENAEFWSYTPSGECSLVFHKTCDIKVGDYHYIDMEFEEGADDNLRWRLENCTHHAEGSAEVYLSWHQNYAHDSRPEGLLNGYVKMYLEAKAKGAIEAFNRPGSKWKVTFTFAEASDGER
jgi:hypothetical protein